MSQEIQAFSNGNETPSKRRNGEALRSAILDRILEETHSGTPGLSAQQVGTIFGIHPTTARFHLEHLVEQGRLIRHRAETDRMSPPNSHKNGRGRPGIIYTPTDQGQAREDMISSLCIALESSIADPQARAESALEAGRTWGRHLSNREHQSAGGPSLSTPSGLPLNVLENLGFRPEPIGEDQRSCYLTACPFMDSAHAHPIICTIHLGMIQGIMAGRGLRAGTRLEPLASPKGCLLEVQTSNEASHKD